MHDMPGTTRDAIDTVVETPDGPICFIDTAGLRRPSQDRSRHRAARDDAGLARARTGRHRPPRHRRHRRGLPPGPAAGRAHRRLGLPGHRRAEQVGPGRDRRSGRRAGRRRRPPGLPRAGTRAQDLGPVGQGRAPDPPGAARLRRRPTTSASRPGRSTAPCRSCRRRQAAPRAKIRYIVQGAIDPPTFTLFTNGRLPQTYLRYIERGLREKFDLGATPMKLRVRIGGQVRCGRA